MLVELGWEPAWVKKMESKSIPKPDKNSGPSCGGAGSGSASCKGKGNNTKAAALDGDGNNPDAGGGFNPIKSMESIHKSSFDPSSLSIDKIRAILYKCHNEGGCDTGPSSSGPLTCPSSISSGDMNKTYDWACKKYNMPICHPANSPPPNYPSSGGNNKWGHKSTIVSGAEYSAYE